MTKDHNDETARPIQACIDLPLEPADQSLVNDEFGILQITPFEKRDPEESDISRFAKISYHE